MSTVISAAPKFSHPWYQGIDVKLDGDKATVTDEATNKVILEATKNPNYKPTSSKYQGMDEYVGSAPDGSNSLTAVLVDRNTKQGARVDLRGQDAYSGGTDLYTITSLRASR
jgi:hypothetical protein